MINRRIINIVKGPTVFKADSKPVWYPDKTKRVIRNKGTYKTCDCGTRIPKRNRKCKKCKTSDKRISDSYPHRKCIGCNKRYKPKSNRQKYCSTDCSNIHSPYRPHLHAINTGFYNTKEWKQIRKDYFSVAINNQCSKCLDKGTLRPAYALDHITPIRLGGTNEWNNLQGLCRSHHQSKSAIEGNSTRMGTFH